MNYSRSINQLSYSYHMHGVWSRLGFNVVRYTSLKEKKKRKKKKRKNNVTTPPPPPRPPQWSIWTEMKWTQCFWISILCIIFVWFRALEVEMWIPQKIRDPVPKNFFKLRLLLRSCLISHGSGSAPAPDFLRQFYFSVLDFNSQYLL